MDYQTMIKEGCKHLKKHHLDAELSSFLIDHHLKLNELDKLNNIVLTNYQVKKYKRAIEKLIKGYAPQYIIGDVNFYGYQFKINDSVLIPRFETEELVLKTLHYMKKMKQGKLKVIDIGTGSGVIGITIKKEYPKALVTLTDISKEALLLAKDNAKKLKAKVTIIKSNMFKNIKGKYDVLISNPPYLKKGDSFIDKLVIDNEPKVALYGGVDGLKHYKIIFKEAKHFLNESFLIALEIDESLVNDLLILIKRYFKNNQYLFEKDNQGRKRMLFIFNFID